MDDYDGEQTAPLLQQRRRPEKAGGAAEKRRSKLLTVCPFILGNEFCERLAFYGLATNFVTYLTHVMGVDAATAAIEVMVFEGTCYVTPLLGAYLADSHWGRYRTILVFSTIYLLGMVALTLTSWLPGLTPPPDEGPTWLQNALLFGALGIIALGTGGIKPNVSAFGADQFDEKDPQDKREKQRFFNWFYLAINVGSLLACTGIVYVQDTVSWSLGFALPAAAMATAVTLFLAGSANYRHVAPTESPMARVAKVVAAALTNRWRSWRRGGAGAGGAKAGPAGGGGGAGEEGDGSLHRALLYQQAQQYGIGGRPGAAPAAAAAAAQRPPRGPGGARPQQQQQQHAAASASSARSTSFRWLEDAITEWQTSQGQLVVAAGGGAQGQAQGLGHLGGYTPQQVEEVKLVLRLLPVFATTVLYWTIYAMMGSMFVQQGSLMDNRVELPGGLELRVPAATMALFNTGAIILLVPLYDAVLEPAIRRAGLRWTLLRRIGWGMLVAVLAMVYAAAVESRRLSIFRRLVGGGPGGGGEGDYGPAVVPLSILWQAPAYVLVGASEVLASIAQLEFFYDQAPDVMRSCSMAMQLLSTALGSYLGGGLVAAVAAASGALGRPWLPRDLNHGHLDYFLLLCGGLMAANTLLFVLVANGYEYKAVEHVVLVQVADDEVEEEEAAPPGLPPRPPAAPRPPRPGGAIAINATSARRSQYHYAAEAADEEGGGLYSRSLAFVPTSPALPAPFR